MADVLIELRPDGLTAIRPVRKLARFTEYQRVVRGLRFDRQSGQVLADGDRAARVLRELGQAGFEVALGEALKRALGVPSHVVPAASPPEKAPKTPPAKPPRKVSKVAASPRATKPPPKPQPPQPAAAKPPPKPQATPPKPKPRYPVVKEIAQQLGETEPSAWGHIRRFCIRLGEPALRELVKEAIAIEARGGMMTQDGSRRRTLGGVFFMLARERRRQQRDQQADGDQASG